jgi:hypothetical protein
MGCVDILDSQRDLYTRGRLLLGAIEGKVKVGPFSPGDFCVPSACPPVIDFIVTRMEIHAECVSVKSRRTVEVGDLQDDRH